MEKIQEAAVENMSDHELVNRLIDGEKALYALIISRYNQRLYRIGMSMLKDDNEVEDVMQVAYIKAYENIRQFSFKSSFSTWLVKILINECLLRLKRRKQQLMRTAIQTDNEYNYPADSQTPASRLVNRELNRILETAISELPEKYRTVFIMREIEHMNVAETKECLAISEVNVKVRLNRAKALLRNSLESIYHKEQLYHFHLSRCSRLAEAVLSKI
jgi:RNA polymerase sigma-70 factor (ECF subfamily)